MTSPENFFSPVKQQKVYTMIVEQVIELINQGKFKPGTQLPPERDLSRHLGVSRASLREALTVLQLMGYVKTISGQGSVICEKKPTSNIPISTLEAYGESPFSILQARKVLEPSIAALASTHHTEAGIKSIQDILTSIDDDPSKDQVLHDVFSEGDRQFHLRIARLTENPILIYMQEIIVHQMKQKLWVTLMRHSSFATPGRWEEARKEHREIFDAIKSSNSQLAASRVKAHLTRVERVMIKADLNFRIPTEE